MPEHVLLVDDDASLNNSLGECLELMGASVSSVYDGDEVEGALADDPTISVLRLDKDMERMSGVDTLQFLLEQRSDLLDRLRCIVFCSLALNDDMHTIASRVREAGHEIHVLDKFDEIPLWEEILSNA